MNLFSKKRINLDYASGGENPSAIYKEGVEVKRKLETARTKIARVLGVQSRDIIFTSGGTESNNLALLGVFNAVKTPSVWNPLTLGVERPHFIISSLEHSAITECAEEIVRRGGDVTIVSADETGRVNPQEVLKNIKPNTVLVSIVYASNEIGTIQPIHKISRLINEYKKEHETNFPYFHTDASQAGKYLSLQISSLGVDLMTLDASKVEGPKGSGLLVVRPNVNVAPIIFGGGQERGLRSGTENVEAIVQFAEALESAQNNRTKESERLFKLRDYFIEEISKNFPRATINGGAATASRGVPPSAVKETLPNIVSITFPKQLAEFMAIKLDQNGIMVSVGSSCDSNKRELEKEAIRFSFGEKTTPKDLEKTIYILKKMC